MTKKKKQWAKYQVTTKSCPVCGAKLQRDSTRLLTSYPPKFALTCPKCDWVETKEAYKVN